jgi:hypothetical protein
MVKKDNILDSASYHSDSENDDSQETINTRYYQINIAANS